MTMGKQSINGPTIYLAEQSVIEALGSHLHLFFLGPFE